MNYETIEVSVTHEIKIDGDKSWVGARITANVNYDSIEETHRELDAKVQELVIKSIESTVKHVQEYTA